MRLLLLFVVLPAVELALLIQLGKRIGTLETLALIAVTGIVGATLARAQGLRVLTRLQDETRAGRMPAEPLVDGAILFVAAALLVTPGVLTDAFGFACLIPATRRLLKDAARRAFERAVASGRVQVVGYDFETGPGPDLGSGPVIDVVPGPPSAGPAGRPEERDPRAPR